MAYNPFTQGQPQPGLNVTSRRPAPQQLGPTYLPRSNQPQLSFGLMGGNRGGGGSFPQGNPFSQAPQFGHMPFGPGLQGLPSGMPPQNPFSYNPTNPPPATPPPFSPAPVNQFTQQPIPTPPPPAPPPAPPPGVLNAPNPLGGVPGVVSGSMGPNPFQRDPRVQ